MNNFFDDNLYFSVTVLARELGVVAENYFNVIGLTPSDAMLMLVVNNKPNVQPTEISEKIKLAPSTITRMVEKLEKKDLLMRTSESKYTFIKATEKGQKLAPSILETWQTVFKYFNDQLDVSTVEKLISQTTDASKKINTIN